jgi:hypothetical protein
VKTVEYHLAKVFAKLGISSRTEPLRLSPFAMIVADNRKHATP